MLQKICRLMHSRLMTGLRSGYARALEDEVARLRAENRALINSILGLAGIPPMRAAEMSAFVAPGLSPGQLRAKAQDGPEACLREQGRPCEIEKPNLQDRPLRRRSWPQIGCMREIADARAARLERESDTKSFPTPANVVPRVR